MGTLTQSVTLIPSNYTGLTGMTINSSYPITRGYADATSTNYTRFDVTQSTTGSVYFLFDTSSIPAGATITSVTARGKARVSSTTRVTNTVMQLYSGTTAKGDNTTFGVTAASTQNLSPGTGWTKSDLNDLQLKIGGTASSSSSSRRIDFYGADVTITYTVPTYTVSATGDGTLDPSTSQEVTSGESYTLIISGLTAKPTVTDNNTDVTSQLTETNDVTETLIPESNTNSGWYGVTNIENAYHDANNSSYADFELAGGGTTGTVYLNIGDISIPSGATIISVSAKATLQYNRNNSSSGFTCSCQMYANTTAKGSSTTVVSAGGTDVAKTTFNLSVGSWTASEINNARFYLTATNNASSTRRHMYIYGVSFEVTYESSGVIYIYTINSVSTNHTIIVTQAIIQTDTLWFKTDNSETLVGTDYSNNYDTHQIYVAVNSGVIVPGDTVRVVLTDIRGWYSGQVKVSGSYEVEFVRNSSYGSGIVQTAYENGASSGKGVRVAQYNANMTLSINPYYSAQTDAEYDGTIEVYKLVEGGWVPAIKVYKKVSGSWVEQSDLSTVFDENTHYIKG